MNTKNIFVILELVALLAVVIAASNLVAPAFAIHETNFRNQGQCVQFWNKLFHEGQIDDILRENQIQNQCKHG
jgi:hypothetical protein